MERQLREKTAKYEKLLEEALENASMEASEGTPVSELASEHVEMATAYLNDGRHFITKGDYVTALAAFSYGHGWIDAAARSGLIQVPKEGALFSI